MDLHLIPACTSKSGARLVNMFSVMLVLHLYVLVGFPVGSVGTWLCPKQSENKDQTSIFPIAFSQMCLSGVFAHSVAFEVSPF